MTMVAILKKLKTYAVSVEEFESSKVMCQNLGSFFIILPQRKESKVSWIQYL